MKSFEAYKKYVALKLHFQSKNYDYFKFSGSVKVSREKFETRNDKYFFDRICKIYDDAQFESLLVSNFINKKDAWVGDVFSEQGRAVYTNWKKKQQSLEYVFKQDLDVIKTLIDEKKIESFDHLFVAQKEQNWPKIVELTLQQTINIETFVIVNKIFNFLPKIDRHIKDELVWPEFRDLCVKYSPFIKISTSKFKTIMRNIFLEEKCT